MYVVHNASLTHTMYAVDGAGGVFKQLTEFLEKRGKLRVITERQDRAGNRCHLWG